MASCSCLSAAPARPDSSAVSSVPLPRVVAAWLAPGPLPRPQPLAAALSPVLPGAVLPGPDTGLPLPIFILLLLSAWAILEPTGHLLAAYRTWQIVHLVCTVFWNFCYRYSTNCLLRLCLWTDGLVHLSPSHFHLLTLERYQISHCLSLTYIDLIATEKVKWLVKLLQIKSM